MKGRLYIITLILGFVSGLIDTISAQDNADSLSYDLPVFEIIANRWNVDLYSTTSMDSTPVILKLHNRISDGIRQAGNNYIRSYGPGRLTGYSVEGASTGQSIVLWEDIPLQNPMNAYTDLSLYDFASFDQISQTSNSEFTLLGNGSMVPALSCSTSIPSNKKSFQTAVEIGSFGSSVLKFQFEQNNKNWISKTTISNQSARSNFPYENLRGETVRLKHAENQALNFQHNQWILHNNNQSSSIHVWYHRSQKNLPRPFANIESQQRQEDEFLNLSIKNKTTFSNSAILNSYIYYQINSNYYEDPNADISNDNRFNTIQYQSALNIKSKFNLGFRSQLFRGSSMNYAETQGHFIQAVFTDFKKQLLNKKAKIKLGARAEWSNRFNIHSGGDISTEYYLNTKHKLNVNLEKTFRYPTLNDLYWTPGGNKDLKPENAYGIRLKYYFKHKLTSFRLNAFSRNTSNLIIWIPRGVIWSPENVQEVWARGIEANLQYVKVFDNINTGLSLKSTYTKATNLSRINPLDDSKDKQLIYTPYFTGFWNGFISWRKNQLTLNHEIQGKQFTNRDNSQYLDAFSLLNLRLSKQIIRPKAEWNIGLNINNILGQDYQLNLGWPMPRQNFQIQISYKTIAE